MRSAVNNAQDFGRVAVLMGGWSAERQVSLWSGAAVHQALVARGIDAEPVDATPEKLLGLKAQGYDRAFVVLHGAGGEDGVAQAALELQGIAYTGSGVGASAIKMDKRAAKRIWKAEGLPTPDFADVTNVKEATAAAQRLGYPLVIKPAAEGSSVGVHIVREASAVAAAYADAHGKGRAVMAERYVSGAELTIAILHGEALPSIRIQPPGEFYDYNAKYLSDDTQYHCPSGVSAEQESLLSRLALHAFALVGASGWGRVDFLLDEAGAPWLLELNTVPGMTSHSLVPMAAQAAGLTFEDLCWRILETSMGRVAA